MNVHDASLHEGEGHDATGAVLHQLCTIRLKVVAHQGRALYDRSAAWPPWQQLYERTSAYGMIQGKVQNAAYQIISRGLLRCLQAQRYLASLGIARLRAGTTYQKLSQQFCFLKCSRRAYNSNEDH